MSDLENIDLSEEQIAEFFEAFTMFDSSESGMIRLQDLKTLLRSLGQSVSEEDIREIMRKVGVAENAGGLDFPEFLKVMSLRLTLVDDEDILQEAFSVFDKDGSGCITSTELKQVMTSLGERMDTADVDAMIAEADEDGDGVINFHEFVKALITK